MQFELSVVIPCLKFGPQVNRLLRSLNNQEPPIHHEIIVVFNQTDPLGEQAVRELGARALCSNQIGVNIARNLGLKSARAPIVLFLDDDCEVHDKSLLFKHWQQHQEFPEVSGVGGMYESPLNATLTQVAYNLMANHWIEFAHHKEVGNYDLLGGNVSYKVERLLPHAEFDPTIEYGGAETEFHLRLVRLGASLLYDRHLAVEHNPQMGPRQLILKGLRQGQTHAAFQPIFESLSIQRGETTRDFDQGWLKAEKFSIKILIALYNFGFSLGLKSKKKAPRGGFALLFYGIRRGALHMRDIFLRVLHTAWINRIHLALRMVLFPGEKATIFLETRSEDVQWRPSSYDSSNQIQ